MKNKNGMDVERRRIERIKASFIDKIIRIEGGYVNDKDDSGGETRYGITKATARAYGYKGRIRDMTEEIARKIYEKKYLGKLRFDEIATQSVEIAWKIADIGINMGIWRAGEFLQQSLNVLNRGGRDYEDLKVDGVIGKKTLKALKRFLRKRGKDGEEVLLKMLNAMQGAFYIELAQRRVKDEKFIFGWFKNRIGGIA